MDINAVQASLYELVNSPGLVHNLLKTAVLFLVLFIIKLLFNRNVENWKNITIEGRRRLLVASRNFMMLTFFIGILIIWGYHIKEFALSIAAVAVAFVLSFKEIIANIMGGLSRAISHEFTIGDRIKVGNSRGDVIDTDMLSTTIMEIGPGDSSHQYTGSSIVIPNSVLLNTPVINETFMQEYLLHVFHVPVSAAEDWRRKERLLLKAARIICEPYLNKARNYMEAMYSKISVDAPSADPRISIVFSKPDEVDLIIRIPVPARRKGRVEQEIIRRYLDMLKSGDEALEEKTSYEE